jgi:HlyD family secretion protein
MKRRIALLAVAIVGVTAAVAAYLNANAAAEAPAFTTAAVTRGSVVETVEATGTLEAVTTVQVGTQVSGTIESLHADFNSRVQRGQVIARLDPALLQAQVDQAQATVARLQADAERTRVTLDDALVKLRRARELFDKQLIPALDVENAEATVRQAEASLKASQAQVTQAQGSLNQSRVNLNHTIITAPVDGIVISRSVDVGQTVAASMSAPTLFVIAKDLAEMQVNASIDESDIGRIEAGQAVTFHVDAYPRETFTGTVSQVRLQPTVAQNVVSYVTVIAVPNRELKLKPGMTANVTIEVARVDNTLRVPGAALRFRPDDQPAEVRGPAVWISQSGQLHAVRVRPGISDGALTAVASDELPEGAQVVTGQTVSAASGATTQPASSPLMPQRPGTNRRQGATR